MDEKISMEDMYKMFPDLEIINNELPNFLNKCRFLSTKYYEKHLELLSVYLKYKKCFQHYLRNITGFGNDLKQIYNVNLTLDVSNSLIDDETFEEFKKKQQEIMEEYERITQDYTKLGVNFTENYEEIKNNIRDLFKVSNTNSIFKDETEIDKQVKKLNDIMQNVINEDSPRFTGILINDIDGNNHTIVMILPTRNSQGNYVYESKQLRIGSSDLYDLFGVHDIVNLKQVLGINDRLG